MNRENYSTPVDLKQIHIEDAFWKKEIELVRTEVIPYQYDALNDKIKDAAKSYCMRNFKVAGKMNQEKREKGAAYIAPQYTFRGFEALPEDPEHPEDDKFYGFVFQDSDFSKWIEAVGYSLTQHPDSELEKIADEAIDIVCAAQQEDGYLDTYYIINGRDKSFTNLKDHHELYCFGHLLEGAVAYYQATGKDKLLNAAKRFADYIATLFGPGKNQIKGYPGHEIAEMALIRLYEVTNDPRYFELSKFFVDERGQRPYYFDKEAFPDGKVKGNINDERYHYHQAHRPVREQDEAVGHAVRAVYLYSGMADVARISGDEKLFEACEKIWDNIVNQKMYITGGIGGTHIGEAFSFNYDLPNDTAYAETCASIGLVFFARRMLEISANSKYSDVMERALYNGVLSGMALDGKSFFYVNPLEVLPTACHKDERKFHVKPVRQKWFGCACCPPNIARLLSSIGSYAYTENEDTLFIHLYMGGKLEKTVGDKTVDICIESQFPWNGDVKIKVHAEHAKMKLALRIPGWADTFTVSKSEYTIKDGYLYLEQEWSEDEITISFPMETRLVEADYRVRENIGKVAVLRGPFVYCLEEMDNGKNLHLLSIKKQTDFTLSTSEITGNTYTKILCNGYRILPNTTGLYSAYATPKKEETTIALIPYYMWANRGENEMQVWTRIE